MFFNRLLIAIVAFFSLTMLAFADHGVTQSNQPVTVKQATSALSEKINLNKATAKDLVQVKGLTETKAKALVSYRKKHGDFKSLDELKEVKGFKRMNEKMLKEIQDQLVI